MGSVVVYWWSFWHILSIHIRIDKKVLFYPEILSSISYLHKSIKIGLPSFVPWYHLLCTDNNIGHNQKGHWFVNYTGC